MFRILDQLIQQSLIDRQLAHAQSTPQHSYQLNNPTGKMFNQQRHEHSFEMLRSNNIPSRRGWGQKEEILSPGLNNSLLINNEMPNSYFKELEESLESLRPLMGDYKLFEDSEDTSSNLRRRHTANDKNATKLSPAKERRQHKLERQQRRQDKKNKRKKEKSRRRKQNKRLKEMLENEDVELHKIDGEEFMDCCPSKIIVVQLQVGKDRWNHAVEVHPDQYVYERVCLQGIEEKECVFPARSLRKGVVTRCAQQFSYVLAQVRPYRSSENWKMDYIYVRSGCSCQVSVSPRKKKNKKKNE